jgi:hypothetical protein
MTHVNLNDGVCEGIRLTDAPAFSVQHHPEAGPGPHDSAYLFEEFEALLTGDRPSLRNGAGNGARTGAGPVGADRLPARVDGLPQPDRGVAGVGAGA